MLTTSFDRIDSLIPTLIHRTRPPNRTYFAPPENVALILMMDRVHSVGSRCEMVTRLHASGMNDPVGLVDKLFPISG